MYLLHFSISSSSSTIAHKVSKNLAKLPLVFFVFEVDAISFREQKQINVLNKICNNEYFDLLPPSRTRSWNSQPIP